MVKGGIAGMDVERDPALLLMFTMLQGICAVNQGAMYNAALGKPAQQSSTYDPRNGAEKAVDGNLAPNFHLSCAATEYHDYSPWWSVDLGGTLPLVSVLVTNRNESPHRLHDFTITVISEEGMPVSECGTWLGTVGSSATVELQCPQVIWGRYVNITKPVNDYSDFLNTCEVQVMAVPWPRHRAVFEKHDLKMNTGSQLITMTTNIRGCTKACANMTGCMSVNYQRSSNECQLLLGKVVANINEDPEWQWHQIIM